MLVLCHGGPIAEPEDARFVLERTRGVAGFFGASSMERLPTEVAMTENMRRFKSPGPGARAMRRVVASAARDAGPRRGVAPAASAATKVPWRRVRQPDGHERPARRSRAGRCSAWTASSAWSWCCAPVAVSGGEEGALRIDKFRCRVEPVEAGTWYWCGNGRRAVLARLVVF